MTPSPQLSCAIRLCCTCQIAIFTVTALAGCQAGRNAKLPQLQGRLKASNVHRVSCLYDQKPWLNLDLTGDRDPEGIHYRIFLLDEKQRGILADGTFHIEIYQIDKLHNNRSTRTLVSDWHYPTGDYSIIQSKVLGMGYHVQLVWKSKAIAGNEIELVTRYEDPDGRIFNAGTYTKRVPKFNY